jgi:uncharacterized protein YktB (UPF0637 family)
MITGGTLTPAYGRDYKNRAQVVESLNKPEDFVISNHTGEGYCSISDLADGHFQVRNKNLRKVWLIEVKHGVAK